MAARDWLQLARCRNSREAWVRRDRSQVAGFEALASRGLIGLTEPWVVGYAPQKQRQDAAVGAPLATCNNRNAGTLPQHWTPKCLIPPKTSLAVSQVFWATDMWQPSPTVACARDSALRKANDGPRWRRVDAACSCASLSLACLKAAGLSLGRDC